jgi:predicted nucleotidyltransferase
MKLEFDVQAVRRFCQERGIARLELFGSALRGDFNADSDVDLLASVRPGVKCGLFEWVDWQEALARIFSRPVDLVISRRGVERSRNPCRKLGQRLGTFASFEPGSERWHALTRFVILC